MNPPGSREELLAMGFTFERRAKCGGKICGATLEWWRRVPGPQIAFRVSLRTGKLVQHGSECPDVQSVRKKKASPFGAGSQTRAPLLTRFWRRVEKTPTCWLWTGSKKHDGYGIFFTVKKQTTAHRFAYELLRGPIPNGCELDHLCRIRACVNPDHLEPVSHRENCLRGESPSAHHARKTKCKYGHEFTPANTYRKYENGKLGGRRCRTCRDLQKAVPQGKLF